MEFPFEFFDFPFEIFMVMKERCVAGTKMGLDIGILGAKNESPFVVYMCINKHVMREEECTRMGMIYDYKPGR